MMTNRESLEATNRFGTNRLVGRLTEEELKALTIVVGTPQQGKTRPATADLSSRPNETGDHDGRH